MLALAAAALPATASIDEAGMELTTPVRQQLRLLHAAWLDWTRAYYGGDAEAATSAVDRLRSIASHLGLERLPDLAAAAATFAVLAAQENDFERARWTLASARRLDPGRPETDFAAAAVDRLAGNYPGTLWNGLRGYGALLELPLERRLWLHGVALRLILAAILSGSLFVALLLATRGEALVGDLARLVSPPVPRPLAGLTAVALLLWPLLLPSGVLWLVLYWSVLLWGYGSTSEKAVLAALWLFFGATPLLLASQQRAVQPNLMPPARVLAHLEAERLYGALFSDLGVLRALLPENPAILELVADLHRRFDQWEHARPLYLTLVEDVDQPAAFHAAPLNNVGLFHLRRKENGTAVSYFQRAGEIDPGSAAILYNLSQAYSQLYEFDLSHEAMAKAKALDGERVDGWTAADGESPEEIGVAVDGGLRRAEEIRTALAAVQRGADRPTGLLDLWRQHFSLSIAVAALLLAVTLHLVRRQLDQRSGVGAGRSVRPAKPESRWLRALVPGWVSARSGHGLRALGAVAFPAILLSLLLLRGFGYRAPLAFDSGAWPAATLGVTGLVLFFLIRVAWELRGTS